MSTYILSFLWSQCKFLNTGFVRDGYCNLFKTDHGQHTVCTIMTEEFLDFTKSKGKDSSSARLDYGFPFSSLEPGNKSCLCTGRWIKAVYEGLRLHL